MTKRLARVAPTKKPPYATIKVTYRSGRKESLPVTREQLEATKARLNALGTVDFFEVK